MESEIHKNHFKGCWCIRYGAAMKMIKLTINDNKNDEEFLRKASVEGMSQQKINDGLNAIIKQAYLRTWIHSIAREGENTQFLRWENEQRILRHGEGKVRRSRCDAREQSTYLVSLFCCTSTQMIATMVYTCNDDEFVHSLFLLIM